MNSRIASLIDAVESVIDICRPVLCPWKVRFMKREPHPTQPNMVQSVWTTEIVNAYNREHAAEQISEEYKQYLKRPLRPSYNCWVTRFRPGYISEEED